ncbi:hypothetical protein DUHN55_21480 [Helicobacter pylori]
MTTVSIVTPAYNEELFLPTMLESLLVQTHTDWELLLVDDGSTDGTASIIEEWATKEPRIKAVSLRQRLGKVAAFNVAYAASTGDLICHVGADDVLPSDSLSRRVKALGNTPQLSVVLGKLQMMDSEGAVISRPFPRGPRGSQSSAGATYTRALADLLFPIPESLPSEDIWLGNGAVGIAHSVRHVADTVYLYRIHGANSNPRHKNFEQMSQAMHSRSRAVSLLAASALPLHSSSRADLLAREKVEEHRYQREYLRILTAPRISVVDKIATLSMSHPFLWTLRQKAGVAATGWRGR